MEKFDVFSNLDSIGKSQGGTTAAPPPSLLMLLALPQPLRQAEMRQVSSVIHTERLLETKSQAAVLKQIGLQVEQLTAECTAAARRVSGAMFSQGRVDQIGVVVCGGTMHRCCEIASRDLSFSAASLDRVSLLQKDSGGEIPMILNTRSLAACTIDRH